MIEFFTNNWESIVAIITATVTLFSLIAKITPTETDDKVVGYLLKLVDLLALNNKPTEVVEKE